MKKKRGFIFVKENSKIFFLLDRSPTTAWKRRTRREERHVRLQIAPSLLTLHQGSQYKPTVVDPKSLHSFVWSSSCQFSSSSFANIEFFSLLKASYSLLSSLVISVLLFPSYPLSISLWCGYLEYFSHLLFFSRVFVFPSHLAEYLASLISLPW
jgi:hypothetical protein